MATHRIKHNYTAGELSPLMAIRDDFERFKNGCAKLLNMEVRTQGPISRRSGFKYIYDLEPLGLDVNNPIVRQIEFIFNEKQAYVLTIFMKADGIPRVVFGTDDGLVVSDGDPCPSEIERILDYTGPGEYEVSGVFGTEPPSAYQVTYISTDSEETELVDGTDYTVTWVNHTGTFIFTAPADTDGSLVIDIESERPGATAGDIIFLDLVENWDIIEADYAQSGDYLYFAMGTVSPHAIVRRDHDCWELVDISFVNQPIDWSDAFGWPETVTLHQQRLAFGGNNTRRQTIWMSMSGSFHDFTTTDSSGEVADDNAIVFTLDSGTQNKIKWMQSSKSLAIGTLGNEWTVSSTITALTPTNVVALRQTNHGSEKIKPLMIGLATMYVELHGRSVNEFIYEYNYDSYQTHDLSVLAPHLTEHYSISSWAYQQTPDSVLWCVREDGDMISLTYQRAHKVAGWHVHDTQGEFVACATIPGNSREDEVWVVVKRLINGKDVWYIEKKDISFISDTSIDAHFLDSFTLYEGEAVSSLTGLGHLEGMSVDVLADGAVHPPLTVTNGAVTLNNSYTTVCLGLPYVSEVMPLLPSLDLQTGTSDGRMQRITDLEIFLYNSLGLEYGRIDSEDGEHAEVLPFRVPGDLTGQAVPLFTGVAHINFPEGFDRDSNYFIRQTQPLPLTVLGVVDVVEAYK